MEKGLVVLTREEGKNDKLRARLEEMQVRSVWMCGWGYGWGPGGGNVTLPKGTIHMMTRLTIPCTNVHQNKQVTVMELPCIAHTLAEGHPALQGALETGGFDYVVITSPEVCRCVCICICV